MSKPINKEYDSLLNSFIEETPYEFERKAKQASKENLALVTMDVVQAKDMEVGRDYLRVALELGVDVDWKDSESHSVRQTAENWNNQEALEMMAAI